MQYLGSAVWGSMQKREVSGSSVHRGDAPLESVRLEVTIAAVTVLANAAWQLHVCGLSV